MGRWPRPGLLLLWLLAGACGLALLAYCAHFDRRRRGAPDFQRRLREREDKKAIEHLANAISLCAHPTQLIHVLEQTLPPQIFEMLVHRIPYVMHRLETTLNEQDPSDE